MDNASNFADVQSSVNYYSSAVSSCNDSALYDNNVSASTCAREIQTQSTCLIYDFTIEAVLMGILCLVGFVGNTLSMICLWSDKSKNATPFLLISLEVSDTLFLVTVLIIRVITSIYQFTNWFAFLVWLFPYFVSYISPIALLANMCTNYLTILVTVNRYISVCKPYEASNLCSVQQARKHVVVVWIICILFNNPRFLETQVYTRVHNVTGENIPRAFPTQLALNQVYQYVYGSAMYFIFIFLIPLISLIVLNHKLIAALHETQKRRAKLLTHDCNHSEDDITHTLIGVVLVFLAIVTQTPALITQILLSALPQFARICPSSVYYFVRISDLVVVANSASNFIIYCFCNKRFRQILINLVCKTKLSSPENNV